MHLIRRDDAGPHEFCHHRVVHCQASNRGPGRRRGANQVGATITDVGDQEMSILDHSSNARGDHPCIFLFEVGRLSNTCMGSKKCPLELLAGSLEITKRTVQVPDLPLRARGVLSGKARGLLSIVGGSDCLDCQATGNLSSSMTSRAISEQVEPTKLCGHCLILRFKQKDGIFIVRTHASSI